MKIGKQNISSTEIIKKISEKDVYLGKYHIGLTSIIIYSACLLVAFLVWLNVSGTNVQMVSREFNNIPIVIENEGELKKNNLDVYGLSYKTVSITVRGPEYKLQELRAEELVASIDVGNINSYGTSRLSVNIDLGKNIDVTINPSSVSAFVDETAEIEVPVVVDKKYQISSDFQFEITPKSESVVVSGAKSILGRIFAARVEADLGVLTSSFSKTEKISLIDAEGDVIESDYIRPLDENIVLDIFVYTEKTVPLRTTFKYGYIKDANIKTTISPKEITLKGEQDVLDNIEFVELPPIDETSINGLNINREILLDLSKYGKVSDANKNQTYTQSISLNRVKSVSVTVDTSSIKVKNPRGLKYKFLDDEITFNCFVATNSANKVSPELFSLELDLSNVATVTGDGLPIVITLAEAQDYTLFPTNTAKVAVTIEG